MAIYCRGCFGLNEEVKRLESKMANPWVDASETMPKVGVAVFVAVRDSIYPHIACRVKASKLYPPWKVGGLYKSGVTHWMPIPDMPVQH